MFGTHRGSLQDRFIAAANQHIENKLERKTSMRKTKLFLVIVALVALVSGCGTMGVFHANNITNVELSEANFNIVARDVQGSAMQGFLIGVGVQQYADVNTYGLIRVSGDKLLYDTAIKALWDDFRDKYGETEGRNLVLINIRQDTDVINALVYTQAELFITADVVEFTE